MIASKVHLKLRIQQFALGKNKTVANNDLSDWLHRSPIECCAEIFFGLTSFGLSAEIAHNRKTMVTGALQKKLKIFEIISKL